MKFFSNIASGKIAIAAMAFLSASLVEAAYAQNPHEAYLSRLHVFPTAPARQNSGQRLAAGDTARMTASDVAPPAFPVATVQHSASPRPTIVHGNHGTPF